MSISILECLYNAKHNLENVSKMPSIMPMVKEQLNNAVVLLEKGYGIWEEVEPLLEKYGDVDNIPEKED